MVSWQERASFLLDEGRPAEAAEVLTRGGAFGAAAKAWGKAGDFEKAAHCLARMKRYADAAEMLLRTVPSGQLHDASKLDARQRRVVLNAAT